MRVDGGELRRCNYLVAILTVICGLWEPRGGFVVASVLGKSVYHDEMSRLYQERILSDEDSAKESLKRAEAAAFKSLNLIHQRYEFSTPRIQFLLVAANMPKTTWDVMKYKTALKFVEKKSTFKFIFGGSSVTAGHDNFYNESYPFVFERRVRDVMESLDINLEIHNIAHGTNKCRPSDLCYEAMGGDDPDWIGWEQSFDCGRDNGVFELMARTAYWNRAVLFFAASGGYRTTHCPPSNDTIPWISEDWTPDNEPSLRGHEYTPTADDLLAFRTRTNAFYEDGNPVARFTDCFKDKYPGVGAHGFSVWGGSKKLCENDVKGGNGCSALDIMGDCQGNFAGNHWMTSEASVYAVGKGAPHHPPRGMHMQRGELLAYNYLHIFLDAVNMIKGDLKTKSLSELSIVYRTELDRLQPQVLPPALHCAPECNTRALCYTDYLPNWNPSHLLDRVIVASSIAESPEDGWVRVSRGSRDEKMGYKDIKIVYETDVVNSTLSLKINVTQTNYLRVCGSNMKDSMKHMRFFLDFNATTDSATYVPTPNIIPWHTKKYAGDECTLLSGVPPGQHVLSLVCTAKCFFTHLVSFE